MRRSSRCEGAPGRPPPDPAILLALWLYATIEGVGSARGLARLCERDLVYSLDRGWGSAEPSRAGRFPRCARCGSRPAAEGRRDGADCGRVVSLAEVAVDGTKVRAQASRASFKTAAKLDRIEATVERRLAALKAEIETDPAASSRRQQAARRRAALDVKARAARARQALDKLRAEKAERAKEP